MRSRHFRLSILAALALGCTTMTATGPSAATAGSSASGPKPAQRVRYRPEVVFSSFGEVDFEHDNQVMQQYFTTLHPQEVTADADGRCFTRARTAKEKLDGVPAKRECLPAPVGAAPAPPSPPAPAPVKVLVDSIPEGIDITNGKIQVADGKGLVLVGRMKWEVPSTDISLASDMDVVNGRYGYVYRRKKAEIVDELKYLARAASANLVLITFIDERTDTAHGAVGLLFHVDLNALDTSKNRLGKVPTEI
ncbi:MAG TPA: hypothetical protein VFA20_23700 [Myxococcaceae bacterium]|nr:hypothetical protein [Myxococcaceae bacterium]